MCRYSLKCYPIIPQISVAVVVTLPAYLGKKFTNIYGFCSDDSIISVVYFRSGYEVEAYPTEKEWAVRLMLERSLAIKCPSIHYHLAGAKKVRLFQHEIHYLN